MNVMPKDKWILSIVKKDVTEIWREASICYVLFNHISPDVCLQKSGFVLEFDAPYVNRYPPLGFLPHQKLHIKYLPKDQLS